MQQDLKEASEKLLNVDKKYMLSLGFKENPHLYPEYYAKNVTLPVIVTYAKSGEEEQAVSFVRHIARLLPDYLTLMYNIGLQTYELFLVRNGKSVISHNRFCFQRALHTYIHLFSCFMQEFFFHPVTNFAVSWWGKFLNYKRLSLNCGIYTYLWNL